MQKYTSVVDLHYCLNPKCELFDFDIINCSAEANQVGDQTTRITISVSVCSFMTSYLPCFLPPHGNNPQVFSAHTF